MDKKLKEYDFNHVKFINDRDKDGYLRMEFSGVWFAALCSLIPFKQDNSILIFNENYDKNNENSKQSYNMAFDYTSYDSGEIDGVFVKGFGEGSSLQAFLINKAKELNLSNPDDEILVIGIEYDPDSNMTVDGFNYGSYGFQYNLSSIIEYLNKMYVRYGYKFASVSKEGL